MHKVEIEVEGTKGLWIYPNLRLLSRGIPFVEFTHSMLEGFHEMHRHITPVMSRIVPVVVPYTPVTEYVTIEPQRFRVRPLRREVWEHLLPTVIGIIQENAGDRVAVKTRGRDQWPMQMLGKK